jgi:hypothetical protein
VVARAHLSTYTRISSISSGQPKSCSHDPVEGAGRQSANVSRGVQTRELCIKRSFSDTVVLVEMVEESSAKQPRERERKDDEPDG